MASEWDQAEVKGPERPLVLLVEPDEQVARAAGAGFAAAGFAVEWAAIGGDALAAAQHELDLVVLDLDTPPGGWDTLARLRAHPATRGVPILALATFSFQEARRALGAGADDALLKPLPPDEIVAAARDLLHRVTGWRYATRAA